MTISVPLPKGVGFHSTCFSWYIYNVKCHFGRLFLVMTLMQPNNKVLPHQNFIQTTQIVWASIKVVHIIHVTLQSSDKAAPIQNKCLIQLFYFGSS